MEVAEIPPLPPFCYEDLSFISSTTDLLNLTYNYDTNNNGEIRSITDARGSAYSTSYTYDALGRLREAQKQDLSSPNTWAFAGSMTAMAIGCRDPISPERSTPTSRIPSNVGGK